MPLTSEPTREALESYGFLPVDFDQWGLTFLYGKDADLIADVDELDDYGDNTRLILRKGRLSKYDIDDARENLEQIYRKIFDKIGMPIMGVKSIDDFLLVTESIPNYMMLQ